MSSQNPDNSKACLREKIAKVCKSLRNSAKRSWQKVRDLVAESTGNGIRILMVRNPSRGRDGNEMFFASTLRSILTPLGYRVWMSVREFWDPSRKYDIMHVHWPKMLFKNKGNAITAHDVERVRERIAELKAEGTAIVYTRHNEIPHYSTNSNEKALYQLFERESDRVIHMGRGSMEQVGGCADGRNVLIPHHGFDRYPIVERKVARAELGLSEGVPVVAAMGSFRAFAERALVVGGCLASEIPGLQVLSSSLFKARSDEPQDRIDELRRLLGSLYPRQREGWVSVREMSCSFAAADVVFIQHVQTLTSGNVPLGFHFGKVVVGPDCGNVGETLRETGNPVFDPADKASVARALKKGFELARSGKGAENARYAREHWNFGLIAKAHDELYRSVLSGGPMLPACYADIPNMGDQLNPLIIGRLFGYGVVPTSVNRAEILPLGSCLRRLAKRKCGRKVFVWGTGFINYDDAEPSPDLDIEYRAVRGELTRRRIELSLGRALDIPMADPGLLAARVLDCPVAKEYDLGVIAHCTEADDPRFLQLAKLAKRTLVIDVRGHPLVVIRQIASCRRIFSSSLHGLIIADSLGIPNLHVKATDKPLGDGFKFDDYYSSFGVPHEFVDLNVEKIESIDVIDRRYRIKPAAVAVKQRQLLESFAFPRVERRTVPSSLPAIAFLVPRGLLHRWARLKYGERFLAPHSKRTRGRLRRMVRFMMPYGVVARSRAKRFREPMRAFLSGDALLKALNWHW